MSAGPLGAPSLKRLERTALATVGVLAAVAFAVRPGTPGLALGVVGGGLLGALAYLGIRSLADAMMPAGEEAAARKGRGWLLVKFFTRHAILALAAYGMMTRLRLDPIGLVIGVSALPVAAAVEAVRMHDGSDRRGPGES